MIRKRKHGYATSAASAALATTASGMPSQGLTCPWFHASAVTYAPTPMKPPCPSETRPKRPITDHDV